MPALRSRAGFTIAELLVASALFGMVTVGVLAFGATSIRLVSRNLAMNHSHETLRISDLRLLRDLNNASSAFRLINFDGTTYSDVTATVTTDQDSTGGKYISNRANGVRFRTLGGGPYKLTATTTPTTANLSFNFGVGGKLPYVPQVGDKLVIPLIDREFDISAVPAVPTTGSLTGTVTISQVGGIGFNIDATTAGNYTTAYFYREVAYTVYGNQLRYHANYTGASKSGYTVVRDKITSPKPFAVLFPTSTTSTDGLSLRVSLEAYDTSFSTRRFNSGTATLRAIIPPRNQPTPVSSTNAS